MRPLAQIPLFSGFSTPTQSLRCDVAVLLAGSTSVSVTPEIYPLASGANHLVHGLLCTSAVPVLWPCYWSGLLLLQSRQNFMAQTSRPGPPERRLSPANAPAIRDLGRASCRCHPSPCRGLAIHLAIRQACHVEIRFQPTLNVAGEDVVRDLAAHGVPSRSRGISNARNASVTSANRKRQRDAPSVFAKCERLGFGPLCAACRHQRQPAIRLNHCAESRTLNAAAYAKVVPNLADH